MLSWKHDINKFAAETAFLNLEELGIYFRLRCHYLYTEKPLSKEFVEALAVKCNQEAVERVMALMFEKDGGCYRSKTLDEIIESSGA